jgi:hypothetical protein
MVTRLVNTNWERFGRKWSWTNRDTTVAFAWRVVQAENSTDISRMKVWSVTVKSSCYVRSFIIDTHRQWCDEDNIGTFILKIETIGST